MPTSVASIRHCRVAAAAGCTRSWCCLRSAALQRVLQICAAAARPVVLQAIHTLKLANPHYCFKRLMTQSNMQLTISSRVLKLCYVTSYNTAEHAWPSMYERLAQGQPLAGCAPCLSCHDTSCSILHFSGLPVRWLSPFEHRNMSFLNLPVALHKIWPGGLAGGARALQPPGAPLEPHLALSAACMALRFADVPPLGLATAPVGSS